MTIIKNYEGIQHVILTLLLNNCIKRRTYNYDNIILGYGIEVN